MRVWRLCCTNTRGPEESSWQKGASSHESLCRQPLSCNSLTEFQPRCTRELASARLPESPPSRERERERGASSCVAFNISRYETVPLLVERCTSWEKDLQMKTTLSAVFSNDLLGFRWGFSALRETLPFTTTKSFETDAENCWMIDYRFVPLSLK